MWIASFTRLESQWRSQSIKFTSCQSDIIRSLIGVFRNAEHWFPEAVCPCKEIRSPESGKFLLVESGIPCRNLSWATRNTAQGIRNPTNNWNSESKFHWQKINNPEFSVTPGFGIHCVEPRILDCLGFLYMGRYRSSVPQFVHLYIFLTRQCTLCRIRRYSYNYFILFSRDDRYWN